MSIWQKRNLLENFLKSVSFNRHHPFDRPEGIRVKKTNSSEMAVPVNTDTRPNECGHGIYADSRRFLAEAFLAPIGRYLSDVELENEFFGSPRNHHTDK